MPAIPLPILYAGLVGVLVALIVATAQQRWQCRVFLILALRVAIGWHFLFEGLHKVHSRYVGPTDTNKVFTSEFYFAAGEGPFADMVRNRFLGDPVATYTPRLAQAKPKTPEEFKKLSKQEQADLCPAPVAAALKLDAAQVEAMNAEAAKLRETANQLPEGTPEEKAKKLEAQVKANSAEAKAKLAADDSRELRASYASWVYGADGGEWLGKESKRELKVKFVTVSSPDAVFSLSGPQRLHHIGMLEKELKDLEERQAAHMGRGEGTDVNKVKTARTELLAAKNNLAKDTETTINELRSLIGLEPMPTPGKEELKQTDKLTAYGIAIIGACILFGVFTPLACLAGAGFLVMTYLSHPTVPWLSLPPMTEGNPLFINKNLIEALGLLVVAVHPTGRWMGFDALWTYFVLPKRDLSTV